MDFFLKKLLSALLLPIPIVIALLFIALILFWTMRHYQKTNITLILALLTLLTFSLHPIPNIMINRLESQYPTLAIMPANAAAIVVLGGGVRGNTESPPNTQLSSASLSRLIEAFRLYHQQPNSKIILSGGRVYGSVSESKTMRNLALVLGIPTKDLMIENGSRDTYHEALYLKPILTHQTFVLVTSAYHMPRAIALFKKQGMHPIAAPTQFIAKQNSYTIKYYLPNATNLIISDIAIHEYLGLLFARITHKV